jgi:hypothetical protein
LVASSAPTMPPTQKPAESQISQRKEMRWPLLL